MRTREIVAPAKIGPSVLAYNIDVLVLLSQDLQKWLEVDSKPVYKRDSRKHLCLARRR